MIDKDFQLDEIERLALADDPSNLGDISDDPEPTIILPAEDFRPGGLYYEMRRELELLRHNVKQMRQHFSEDKDD